MPPGLQNPPKNPKIQGVGEIPENPGISPIPLRGGVAVFPPQLRDSNFGCVGGGDWEAPVWGWSCTRTARRPPRTWIVCLPHRDTVLSLERIYSLYRANRVSIENIESL